MNYYTVEWRPGPRRRLKTTLISAETLEDAEVLGRALIEKKDGAELVDVRVYYAGRGGS